MPRSFRNDRGHRLVALALAVIILSHSAAQAEPTRDIVAYDEVRIEILAQGQGPLVVMLPSRGRGAEDFDAVADIVAKAGFRVLRPQPRGAGQTKGPLHDLTLHDLARDVATVIRHENAGPAVIVGHAFGSWVARMAAVDHPGLVRGVVAVAAAAKAYPAGFAGAKELSAAVRKSGDANLSDVERLRYLQFAFFAPGHDATIWLQGWHREADEAEAAAGRATKQSEWWSAGTAPFLDVQGALDPFKPRSMMNEARDEFGDRASVVVIPDASHAMLPEQPAAVAQAIVDWLRKLPR